MNDDLTPFFLQAIQRIEQWSPEMLPRLLEIITGLLGLAQGSENGTITIDWNRELVERWGRVLYDRYVVVISHLELPLIIMLDTYASVLRSQLEETGAVVVGIENFETRQYHLDLDSLQRAYPGFRWHGEIDAHTDLAIVDLWWSTL